MSHAAAIHDVTCPTCGHASVRDRERIGQERTPARRAYDRERKASWRARNPERSREINRAANTRIGRQAARREWDAANPRIKSGGEVFRVSSLPEPLRPIALLIRETRRELKGRTR